MQAFKRSIESMRVSSNTAVAHYRELARIGKVLASPVRLRLLDLLRQGTRTVEALAGAAGESVANSSQHLQHMRAAGLVSAERHGKHVEYRLASEGVSTMFASLRELGEAVLPEMARLRRELGALPGAERRILLSRIRSGEVTLVDVRPEEEYRAGHVPGARSIPLCELRARMGELPRRGEVVACCRGPYCPFARDAAEILRAAGFRATHLDLGVPDLRALRFPVSASDARPPSARRTPPRSRQPINDPERKTDEDPVDHPGRRARPAERPRRGRVRLR
jgi:rhodanese-related sulfurtransferase/DNA-binding transcriptional ArsR family regulator